MENQDSYTEVSTESWGSRIMGSIKSILFGFVLFIGAFAVLWWNEGRAVRTARGLEEGAAQVVTVDAQNPDAANAGKLVHLSGQVATPDTLADPDFDLQANALKLRRVVSMYQWVEKKETDKEKKMGGGTETKTTYTYEKKWDRNLIKSEDFKIRDGHTNPQAFPYAAYEQKAQTASIGAFKLSTSLISSLSQYEPISVGAIDTAVHKNARLINEGEASVSNGLAINQKIYIGKGSPEAPEVGDIKVSFDVVKADVDYSVVATQQGDSFVPFQTTEGTSIQMIRPGVVSSADMFEAAQSSNTIMTWVLRFVGFIMMFAGLSMIFNPLAVLADVVPFLGTLLGGGITLVAGLVSAVFSCLTIAIAWVFYRPVIGLSIMAIAVGIIVFLFVRASKKKKEEEEKVAVGA